jgi:uncharacterized protein
VIREALALGVAMAFPTVMAWLNFVELARPGDAVNPALLAAFQAGKVVQFLFPLLYVWLVVREPARPRRPTGRGLLLGVVFGLLTCLLLWRLYSYLRYETALLEGTPARIYGKLVELGMATPGRYLVLALLICVAHSLLEEYYWRWFIFGRLKRLVPVWAAVLLSSLSFMAHHVIILGVYLPGHFWTLAVPLSLCVAVGGAFWAWLYHASGSLYAPWLSHLLIDAGIFAVGFDLVRGSMGM